MNSVLARQVRQRAGDCCEYCQIPQDYDYPGFEIDHIIPRKHGGTSGSHNLALSCFWCNSFKGTDLAGLDPRTRKLTPLFNPRRHKWSRHFRWDGPLLSGLTPMGRVTISVLRINDPYRATLRANLIDQGVFPPSVRSG